MLTEIGDMADCMIEIVQKAAPKKLPVQVVLHISDGCFHTMIEFDLQDIFGPRDAGLLVVREIQVSTWVDQIRDQLRNCVVSERSDKLRVYWGGRHA